MEMHSIFLRVPTLLCELRLLPKQQKITEEMLTQTQSFSPTFIFNQIVLKLKAGSAFKI